MSRAQLAVVAFAITTTLVSIPTIASAHKAHHEALAEKTEHAPESQPPAEGASVEAVAAPLAPAEREVPTTKLEAAARADEARGASKILSEPTAASGVPGTAAVPPGLFTMLGRLHPMATHFPIALFIVAGVAEFLFATTRLPQVGSPVRFLVWSASASAVGVAPLGWLFAATSQTEVGWILETHRWAGTTAALSGLLVLWLCERVERRGGGRGGFRAALLIQAFLIGATGFLGGSLLYGIDHLWRSS